MTGPIEQEIDATEDDFAELDRIAAAAWTIFSEAAVGPTFEHGAPFNFGDQWYEIGETERIAFRAAIDGVLMFTQARTSTTVQGPPMSEDDAFDFEAAAELARVSIAEARELRLAIRRAGFKATRDPGSIAFELEVDDGAESVDEADEHDAEVVEVGKPAAKSHMMSLLEELPIVGESGFATPRAQIRFRCGDQPGIATDDAPFVILAMPKPQGLANQFIVATVGTPVQLWNLTKAIIQNMKEAGIVDMAKAGALDDRPMPAGKVIANKLYEGP